MRIQHDDDGNGENDRSELTVVNADGSTSRTIVESNPDGTLRSLVMTNVSADGLRANVKSDVDGNGTIDEVLDEFTTLNVDGSRTKTVTRRAENEALLSRTVETVSANGLVETATQDMDGDGDIDAKTTEVTVLNLDGSKTQTVTNVAGANTVKNRVVTTIDATGLKATVQTDADGDGTIDRTFVSATTLNADGSTVETVEGRSADGTLLSKITTSASADKRTIAASEDANGDGAIDASRTIVVNADGSTTTTGRLLNGDGTLKSTVQTVLTANGLSKTSKSDVTGDGVHDFTETDVTALNADGSRTRTVSVTSASGTLTGKTITMTAANGLTTTEQSDLTGDGVVDRTVTDETVLNGDGSQTRDLNTRSADGTLLSHVTVVKQADNKHNVTYVDANGDGKHDRIEISDLSSDGTLSETVSNRTADGAVISSTETITSADGLTIFVEVDANGDGFDDLKTTDATGLNADGSRTRTLSKQAGTGALLSQTVTTTSASGLVVTSEMDVNGDGNLDARTSDVTVLSQDGSTTRTVSNLTGNGALKDKSVTTVSANGFSTTVVADLDGDGTADRTTGTLKELKADGSVVETVSVKSGSDKLIAKTMATTSRDKRQVTTNTDLDGDLVNDVTGTQIVNQDGSTTSTVSTYATDGSEARLQSRSVETVSANGLTKRRETDLNGDGAFDRSSESAIVLNANGSKTETIQEFGANRTPKSKTVIETSANGLSETTTWSATGGAVTRTRSDVTTLNVNGSTLNTLTYQRAGGALESKTATVVSPNKMSTTILKDIDGDGIFDQKSIANINADGSLTNTLIDLATDGVTHVDKKTIIVSADSLSRTTDYDSNGDGVLEARTTETTVLNGNGSRTETIVHHNGSLQVLDKTVVETSADRLTITEKWDLNADGTFDKSRTDVTVLNGDGSRTQTLSNLVGSGLTRRTETKTSANGLSTTERWDLDGNGSYDQTSTDATALNSDGSVTRTVANTRADGSLIAKSVETTSADGRTVAVAEDRSDSGLGSRTLVTSKSVLADGSLVETLSVMDAAQKLAEKQTLTSSADKREIDILRDADGDGDIDQTEQHRKLVDGSQETIITNYRNGGGTADKTTIRTSADGLATTTEWDLDGNGTIDRRRTAANAFNMNGSQSSIATDTRADGTLVNKTTATMSADGRTSVVSRDVNSDGIIDNVETTATDITGGTVSTVVTNVEGRNIANLIAGEIYWDKKIALKAETTVSADGLTRTVRSDFDCNGSLEHVMVATAQIDGSIVSTITETNADGSVKARGTITESADGRVKTLQKDSNNDGTYDHKQTAVTRIDGSITLTAVDRNPNGTLKQTVTEEISATGKLTHRLTTDSANRRTAEFLLLADGTATDSTYDAASGQLLSVRRLNKDGVLTSASFYDPLDVETWSDAAQYFNAAGQMTSQVINEDDGSKKTTWYDTASVATWSERSEINGASGALIQSRTVGDDGLWVVTHYDPDNTWAWSTLVEYFNAADQLTTQVQNKDDGTAETTWFDVAKNQTWSQRTSVVNASGALTQSSFLNDDGTRATTYYDATNTQVWSTLVQHFNAAGKLTHQVQNKDDGTQETIWYDVANNQTWSQLTDTKNASGALTRSATLNDDRSQVVTFYDPTNTQVWSSLVQYLNAAGQLTQQIQTKDNGTKETSWHDVANAQTWSQIDEIKNASGAVTQSTTRYDNGTRTAIYYDPTNVQAWSALTQYLNAAGQLTQQIQNKDNGTKETSWYDVASQSWSQITEINNASGALTQKATYYDNGTRTAIYYDPTNVQVWSTLTQYLNAAGQLTQQAQDNDNGTKDSSWYDVANAEAWSRITENRNASGTLIRQTTYWDDGTSTVSVPPILLDLDGDGRIEIQPLGATESADATSPRFDWDGDGVSDPTAWAGPQDGFLAIDLAANGSAGPDGVIDQTKELAFSLWADGEKNVPSGPVSDLEGLRVAFDTNDDNILDGRDARWNEFRVWQDADQDGTTDAGELRTMSEAGIKLVNLDSAAEGAKRFADGSTIVGTSFFEAVNGTKSLVADAALAFRPSDGTGAPQNYAAVDRLIAAMVAFQPTEAVKTNVLQPDDPRIGDPQTVTITATSSWMAA